MKFYRCIIFIIALISFEEIVAQNYFYVHGNFSPSQKKEIRSQIEYFTELFQMQNVTLAVFKNELPRKLNAIIEYQPNQLNGRKMILIRLNKKLDESNYLSTISHEMIHACQYYTGELIRHDRTNFSWRGKHFKRPWEIEANKKTDDLCHSYMEFLKNQHMLSKAKSFENSAH